MMNYQKVHSPLPTFIQCPFKLKIEARVYIYNKFMIIHYYMFKFTNVYVKEEVVVYVIILYTCTCLTHKMLINVKALYITHARYTA